MVILKSRCNRKNQLNIAMLGHKRIPSREGGIEIVVEELSTRLVGLGHYVTCYNRKGHHVSGKEFDNRKLTEYKGVKIKSVFTLNKKGLAAMTASMVASVCAAFGKYNIVHFHAEGTCAMIWLPKLFGKNCVATIHGLDHQRSKWGKLASAYIMFGEKCAVKYANEIIVLSKSAQDYFHEVYGRDTQFIPNGVNRPIIHEAEIIKKKFGLEKDSYILFVGRIVPEKGLEYLIEAFKKIKTEKKLVIAGGSSDTYLFLENLKKLTQEDNRIMFTGFVQGDTLDELYSNAYIYILPSDLEGMPLSLLEAMSYGNCCIVSDINECASVVEDKAIIFQKGSVSDLQKKMQSTIDNPEIVKRYKNLSSEFICMKYSWDDVVERTIKLYKKQS